MMSRSWCRLWFRLRVWSISRFWFRLRFRGRVRSISRFWFRLWFRGRVRSISRFWFRLWFRGRVRSIGRFWFRLWFRGRLRYMIIFALCPMSIVTFAFLDVTFVILIMMDFFAIIMTRFFTHNSGKRRQCGSCNSEQHHKIASKKRLHG